jgi:Lhr-like helicase
MENKNVQRKQLEERLIAKATKDETFRNNLLTSPREALETELGITIPDTVIIKVLEEDQNSFYLVLPPIINPETEDELSEAELEMVSGGWDGPGGMSVDCTTNEVGCIGGPSFSN